MDKTVESIDKSLSFLIDGATEKGTKLVDWLYVQAPDVMGQLLMWHGARSLVSFIVGILAVIGLPLLCYKGIKMWYNKLEVEQVKNNCRWKPLEDPTLIVPSFIASVITAAVTIACGVNLLNLTWLQIWIAPKVYVMEYISNLVK